MFLKFLIVKDFKKLILEIECSGTNENNKPYVFAYFDYITIIYNEIINKFFLALFIISIKIYFKFFAEKLKYLKKIFLNL